MKIGRNFYLGQDPDPDPEVSKVGSGYGQKSSGSATLVSDVHNQTCLQFLVSTETTAPEVRYNFFLSAGKMLQEKVSFKPIQEGNIYLHSWQVVRMGDFVIFCSYCILFFLTMRFPESLDV
jgi:hypothetical protein